MKVFHPLPFIVFTGCENWPAYKNVDFDHEGYPAEYSDSETLSAMLDWSGPLDEQEANDMARIGEWLQSDSGWHIQGNLSGLGWDSDLEPDYNSTSDCNDSLEFPSTDGGNYTGDIDWIGLLARENGTLCMNIELDLSEGASGIQYDILLYRLNACGDPVQVYVDDNEEVLGWNSSGDRTSWSTGVEAGKILGVVLVGTSPNNTELDVPWNIAISLIDLPTAGVCPTSPWH